MIENYTEPHFVLNQIRLRLQKFIQLTFCEHGYKKEKVLSCSEKGEKNSTPAVKLLTNAKKMYCYPQ